MNQVRLRTPWFDGWMVSGADGSAPTEESEMRLHVTVPRCWYSFIFNPSPLFVPILVRLTFALVFFVASVLRPRQLGP
jgi:hypothetical protein